MTTTTVTSVCRAANPNFCRYHGNARRGGFERNVQSYVRNLRTSFDNTTNLDRRYEIEEQLKEAEISYAATLVGEEEIRNRIEQSDGFEREKLEEVLQKGLQLRARVEEEEEPGITRFPASKIGEAVHRIEKANRKLARAGIQEQFEYEIENYQRTDDQGNLFQMAKLTLSAPSISENGWSFVAAVDKAGGDEEALITRVAPGQDLNGYRPDQFICEHCGSHRLRRSTYILRHEDGTIKQVGTNCLEPFLGVKPRGLWALGYELEDNGQIIDQHGPSVGGADHLLPTQGVVAMALAASNGGNDYVPSSFGGETTVSRVREAIFSTSARRDREELDPEPYMQQAAELISNTTFSGEGDYAQNMRTLMNQEYVTPRHLGYVTSVIAAANRERRNAEREAARAARVRSVGFLAEEGEKVTNVPVTVKRVFTFESNYGYTPTTGRTLILTTDDGQEVKWSTTGNDDLIWSAAEGQKFILDRATIKGHSRYQEDDQTVITRAKLSEAGEQ